MKEIILQILKEKGINSTEITGWNLSDIENVENVFMEGRKYPAMIRTYLKTAGNVIGLTRKSSIDGFYKYELKEGGLNEEIKKWAKEDPYCIVAYYGEGDFVFFSLLNDNENPAVYVNEFVQIEDGENVNYKIKFKKVADKFTDFIGNMTEY